MNKHLFLLIAAFQLFYATASAQSISGISPAKDRPQFSVLFGLNQPIVFKGFNVELSYWTKKWVFDYSHGFGLQVAGKMLGDEYTAQRLDFKITHTLGFGIGYRFTEGFNVRFEPKIHFYETYYEGETHKKANSLRNFATYTLGLGAYYKWHPFAKTGNALSGITVAPSVRYWYKVGSSMADGKYAYFNTKTNRTETLKAPNIGISNTPFVFNVSVGYTF